MSEMRRLRADDEMVTSLLARAGRISEDPSQLSRRQSERFEYHVRTLIVDFPHTGGVTRYSIPARDISRQGISFLIGNFVYPGTACRVRLVSDYSQSLTVEGTVTRCRYLAGSTNIYDVGVRLAQEIDVAMFHRDASALHVLLVDSDPTAEKLVRHFLTGGAAELDATADAADAATRAKDGNYDAILINTCDTKIDATALAKRLRDEGFARAIIALTVEDSDEDRTRLTEAGFSDIMLKPVTRERLITALDALRTEPVVSSVVCDPAMAPLIDSFVTSLQESITRLESALAGKDVETLRQVVRHLKGTAGSFGFDVISEAASKTDAELKNGADSAEARTAALTLMRLCRAARGARTAAP
ncbi:MAG: response regulator [Phycisphaerales bacterium]|nr:response regulator [Phycisphaerales bacterium]